MIRLPLLPVHSICFVFGVCDGDWDPYKTVVGSNYTRSSEIIPPALAPPLEFNLSRVGFNVLQLYEEVWVLCTCRRRQEVRRVPSSQRRAFSQLQRLSRWLRCGCL